MRINAWITASIVLSFPASLFLKNCLKRMWMTQGLPIDMK